MKNNSMNVNEGLAYIQRFIKAASIYGACGKSAVWFSQRYNSGVCRGVVYKFSENDVKLLNEALHRVAVELDCKMLSAIADRNTFLEQVRELLKTVKRNYLKDEVICCNTSYWNNRTQPSEKADSCYRFSEEELNAINNAVKHISVELSHITLTL